MTEKKEPQKNRPSASFTVGAVALVFLILGYNVALFMFRASAALIVSHRDRPDTVYVISPPADTLSLTANADMQPQSPYRHLPQAAPDSGADRGAVTVRRDAAHSPVAEAVHERYSVRGPESFRFNPNTVSVSDLRRLGFTEKQARAIDNYRQSGGRFRRKEDFARSFVVADSVFRRLEAYIDIPLLDINSADSAAFDALPGIGPYFASRMVSYRNELGGYSYPEQLMDIWKFDAEKYDALKDLIMVGPCEPYPLWTLPEDSLKLHPYIRSYAAHGIVLFRENSPVREWTVQNLADAGILKPENAVKLERCRIKVPEVGNN